MLKTVRSIASLLLSYGLLLVAMGLFNTLLGVRSQIEGFSTEVIGVIMAGYFAGLLLGALYAVQVVIRAGHIRAFAAFASLISIAALVHLLWIEPIAWFVLRLLSGFCMAGMFIVTESWLNERATNEIRGQVLSLYMMTNYFSAGCGQYLLPLADPAEFQLFCIASILFSLALVPVLLTRSSAPVLVKPKRLRFLDLYRTSPLGVWGVFCAGLVNAAFYGMGPVFAQDVGLSIAGTSTFMAAVIFGGLLLQWPVGRLSDRVDRRKVMISLALATSVACVATVVIIDFGRFWLFLIAAVYGGLSFTIYPLSIAHTNDFAAPELRIQVASGLLVAYGIGASAGPIMAAMFMGQLGPEGMFVYSALVMGALGAFGYYRTRRRAPKSSEEHGRYIVTPGGQFTSEELYATVRDQMDKDLARIIGGRAHPLAR